MRHMSKTQRIILGIVFAVLILLSMFVPKCKADVWETYKDNRFKALTDDVAERKAILEEMIKTLKEVNKEDKQKDMLQFGNITTNSNPKQEKGE